MQYATGVHGRAVKVAVRRPMNIGGMMAMDPSSKQSAARDRLGWRVQLSYYEVLGVSLSASQSEIEAAFQKWRRVYNPETHPDPARAAQLAKEIAEAYFVLHDPERRKEHDRQLGLLSHLGVPQHEEASRQGKSLRKGSGASIKELLVAGVGVGAALVWAVIGTFFLILAWVVWPSGAASKPLASLTLTDVFLTLLSVQCLCGCLWALCTALDSLFWTGHRLLWRSGVGG